MLNTSIRGLQIKDAFFGVGLKRNVGDGNIAEIDLYELSDTAIAVSADSIPFIDATDNSSKKESVADLVTAIAGTGLTATNGVLSVNAISGDVILEADVLVENESANCNGITTDFTLASTPLASSVQVFLNGLLQEEGSGKDYTRSGTTVSFATAPATGDILIIHYIVNN